MRLFLEPIPEPNQTCSRYAQAPSERIPITSEQLVVPWSPDGPREILLWTREILVEESDVASGARLHILLSSLDRGIGLKCQVSNSKGREILNLASAGVPETLSGSTQRLRAGRYTVIVRGTAWQAPGCGRYTATLHLIGDGLVQHGEVAREGGMQILTKSAIDILRYASPPTQVDVPPSGIALSGEYLIGAESVIRIERPRGVVAVEFQDYVSREQHVQVYQNGRMGNPKPISVIRCRSGSLTLAVLPSPTPSTVIVRLLPPQESAVLGIRILSSEPPPCSPGIAISGVDALDLSPTKARDRLPNVHRAARIPVRLNLGYPGTVHVVGPTPIHADGPYPLAIRIEVHCEPIWLPLEVVITSNNRTIHRASREGNSRFLLAVEELPAGEYSFAVLSSHQRLDSDLWICGELLFVYELGVSSLYEQNSMRSELLDIPGVLAAQPLPSSLNWPGWYGEPGSHPDVVVGTILARFDGRTAVTSVTVSEDSLLRMTHQPTELANHLVNVKLSRIAGKTSQPLRRVESGTLSRAGENYVSNQRGEMLALLLKGGTYQIEVEAHEEFMVTIAIGKWKLAEDRTHQTPCGSEMPQLIGSNPHETHIWEGLIDLEHLTSSVVGRESVKVDTLSIGQFEVGGDFLLDNVELGLHTPEGLWVGERRQRRSVLVTDLAPGTYSLEMKVSALRIPSQFGMCRRLSTFSHIEASPHIHEINGKDENCELLGALPLPLGWSESDDGASGFLANGQIPMLVRQKIVMSSIHGGRKKTYIPNNSHGKLYAKVGIFGGDQLSSHLTLHGSDMPDGRPFPGMTSWEDEWSRTAACTLEAGKGLWISIRDETPAEITSTHCHSIYFMMQVMGLQHLTGLGSCTAAKVTPTSLIPRQLPDEVSTEVKAVEQPPGGLLVERTFMVSDKSFLETGVGYNYILGNVETEVVDSAGEVVATVLRKLEEVCQVDVGHRGIGPLIRPGVLNEAVEALSSPPEGGRAIIITGMPCCISKPPPQFESDGLIGSVCVARALESVGWRVALGSEPDIAEVLKRLAKDEIDVVGFEPQSSPDEITAKAGKIDLVVCIERASPPYKTMRNLQMDPAKIAPLECLSEIDGVRTVAIGDGGNEMGLGPLQDLVAKYIPLGDQIKTATKSDFCLVAGTSDWGSLALAMALGMRWSREQHQELCLALEAMGVRDGVTGEPGQTLDGIPIGGSAFNDLQAEVRRWSLQAERMADEKVLPWARRRTFELEEFRSRLPPEDAEKLLKLFIEHLWFTVPPLVAALAETPANENVDLKMIAIDLVTKANQRPDVALFVLGLAKDNLSEEAVQQIGSELGTHFMSSPGCLRQCETLFVSGSVMTSDKLCDVTMSRMSTVYPNEHDLLVLRTVVKCLVERNSDLAESYFYKCLDKLNINLDSSDQPLGVQAAYLLIEATKGEAPPRSFFEDVVLRYWLVFCRDRFIRNTVERKLSSFANPDFAVLWPIQGLSTFQEEARQSTRVVLTWKAFWTHYEFNTPHN
ncbi:hypothetical protein FOL47_000199 [Perkinsus chesapeaki]|uniref:D-glutamate cyclase-like C-terminal domain-containing protein n=1 Tax=Perkinsus chesapeaki TaxID=330153 RepID=A0A7J6MNA7_PERCH|nr:hypothetical protein FOL47_000199 [Perkinsus chesapeaki]